MWRVSSCWKEYPPSRIGESGSSNSTWKAWPYTWTANTSRNLRRSSDSEAPMCPIAEPNEISQFNQRSPSASKRNNSFWLPSKRWLFASIAENFFGSRAAAKSALLVSSGTYASLVDCNIHKRSGATFGMYSALRNAGSCGGAFVIHVKSSARRQPSADARRARLTPRG